LDTSLVLLESIELFGGDERVPRKCLEVVESLEHTACVRVEFLDIHLVGGFEEAGDSLDGLLVSSHIPGQHISSLSGEKVHLCLPLIPRLDVSLDEQGDEDRYRD
jgi:hypothetical protein